MKVTRRRFIQGTAAAGDHVVELLFDAQACVACGLCVDRCPERRRGAIDLTPAVDPVALRAPPRVLNESALLMCERCGGPLASSAVMSRLATVLGGEDRAMATVGRYCIDCRGSRLVF